MTNTATVTLATVASAGPLPKSPIEVRGTPALSSAKAQASTPIPSTPNLVFGTNPADNKRHEWLAVDWLEDSAQTGEQVTRYIKADRLGNASIWGMCIEVRDASHSPAALHGIEVDLCTDSDPGGCKFGQAIYYGGQTNTFGPGEPTYADAGLRVWPFVFGRNAVRAGMNVEGKCAEGALVVGHHGDSETRHAVSMGPGVTLKWASAEGKAHPTAWHSLPREFSVEEFPVVGLIDIEVDGTTLQIPVFRKTV